MGTLRNIWQDNSFRTSIVLTLLFLTLGFAMLRFGWVGYGWAFFLLLPVVTGFAIGAYPNRDWATVGMVVGAFFFLLGILSMGLEGLVCVLMALPLILPPLFLGAVIAHLVRRYQVIKRLDSSPLLLLPFLVFLMGAAWENSGRAQPEIREVRTEIVLPYTPQEVYDAIKSVDTLDAEKPFLLRVGLPVPQKCVLEREAVGAKRTCYFDGGQIVEQVTELEPGRILRMNVTDYRVLGMKWLQFREAIYTFEPLPGRQTKLTRITTYSSALHPQMYWEPLEKWGIEQEHQYVFSNLEKDLHAAN